MNAWFEREKLHFAASDGDLEEVRRLVEEGFDVNAFDEALSLTPLHYAVREEHLEVAEYLISVGADVNAHDRDKAGETPLGAVAADCSYAVASLLIRAGANPTIKGWMQITALHRASRRSTEEGKRVYELLLESTKAGDDVRA